jgi:hypothetical protein
MNSDRTQPAVACPHCNRVLFSRQQANCGYCGAKLPPGLRFPEAKISQVQSARKEIVERVKKAHAKENDERRQHNGTPA